ncbi:hypothetical protein GCM10025867_20760 [Frondihabitans sucicola]|uniref:MHYT domain-containing protein n=1 Tax=Frondihabitans sucicola TaxID=1268041 RepID=A0ABN6Y1K4_9MICO|nr:hypothetical protein GCM10025867_20760 [Frondihabitans sucicola]
MLVFCAAHTGYITNSPAEKQEVMFIGLGVLVVAAAAAIVGTFVSTARDGYRRQPTRSFD